MANVDLSQYGITGVTEILHNPSYKVLFEEETKDGLTGYEKGQVSELGAVDVKTGIFTGRSPTNSSSMMRRPMTRFGGIATHTITITTRPRKRLGLLLRISQRKSFPISASSSLMVSAARTRTRAWQFVSSLRLLGRLIS